MFEVFVKRPNDILRVEEVFGNLLIFIPAFPYSLGEIFSKNFLRLDIEGQVTASRHVETKICRCYDDAANGTGVVGLQFSQLKRLELCQTLVQFFDA